MTRSSQKTNTHRHILFLTRFNKLIFLNLFLQIASDSKMYLFLFYRVLNKKTAYVCKRNVFLRTYDICFVYTFPHTSYFIGFKTYLK